ncbi:hypothetical protein [Pseudomonas tohonis]|uniref:hypothetical protein n=1 Tax=Pseudomonas tohonis TaxID=2725477 RepID=UPI001F222374|nr:hypothetical protein [Pseudomonas tohonis]
MKLGIGVVVGVFALAGCAGRQDVEPRVVRVEVPMTVPCRVEEVAVPPWAASTLRAGDSLEVKVRTLLAERRQRIGYERELVAVATSCQ